MSPGLAPAGTRPFLQMGYSFMVLGQSACYKKEEAAQADKKAISANNSSSNNIYDLLLQSAHLHFE